MQTETLKWLAISGIVTPIFHLVIPLIVGALAPGYKTMRQFISELALLKRPYPTLVNILFIIKGLLTIVFAIALYVGLPGGNISWIAPALFVFHGMSHVVAGIFPVDTKSLAGRVHTFISQLGAMSALVSPFFVWLAIRHDGRWQDVSVFTLVMQVALLVVFALFSYVTETRRKASSKAVIGLFQRLYLGVYYTWLVVVAVELIRWHR